ncbi:NAD-dependent epimerase/dehydratase family protein [Oribacterium sp. oral taxon 108]|uniref:NAD-dependent epimerase/dehydratase family protein n=1 Tax=Oribacterium sp. oral taxon 108 TaxID=712414 RepID=UPI00020DDEAF|nr:NAD(P)-dependent oxidoreductase [Oribacterium sp. oral taxon 108]EGL37629.1 NAD dependent epimerase/dehydratase family protein [Oribacterium sp. oral taxon 108 str. F0425]
MRILISGITSFLGISTGKALLKKGHEVYGILRPESRNKERLKGEKGIQLLSLNMESFLLWEKEHGIEAEYNNSTTEAGITTERNATSENLSPVSPAPFSELHFDAVLHFAWDGVGSLGRSDIATQEKNLRMSKAFFSWAKAHGVKRFFFAGSQAEMGRGTREEPLPASPYGEKKLAFSEYGLKNHGKMEFIDLRIYSIYGKGDHERSLVKTLVRNTLRGMETELGSGNKIWNFMAEEDFGRALAFLTDLDIQTRKEESRKQGSKKSESADSETEYKEKQLESGLSGQGKDCGSFTIDICSRESRLLSDYIKEIEQIGFSFLKKKGIRKSEESLLRFGLRPPNVEGDYDFTAHTKELSALGFEERVSFSSGIEELYEWIYEKEFLKV